MTFKAVLIDVDMPKTMQTKGTFLNTFTTWALKEGFFFGSDPFIKKIKGVQHNLNLKARSKRSLNSVLEHRVVKIRMSGCTTEGVGLNYRVGGASGTVPLKGVGVLRLRLR